MNIKSIFSLVAMVAATATPSITQGEIIRLNYNHKVLAQPGPLPGTIVLRSNLHLLGMVTKDGQQPGLPYGACYTLIRESDLTRDFEKKPLSKDEVLGFSCANDEKVQP